jgi:hypothetical protein
VTPFPQDFLPKLFEAHVPPLTLSRNIAFAPLTLRLYVSYDSHSEKRLFV